MASGRPHVLLAADAPLVLAAGVEHGGEHRVVGERGAVRAHGLFHHSKQPMPPTLLAVPRKYLSTRSRFQSDRLEDLGPAVRHVRADAHLRHDLVEALPTASRSSDRLFGVDAVQRDQGLEREVRMGRLGA